MNTDFKTTTDGTCTPRGHAGPTLPPGWISPRKCRLAWSALLSASLVASFQAVELAVSAFSGGVGGDWMDLAVHSGVLAMLPMLMAMKVCGSLRRRGNALENGHIDTFTGLYNRAGLVVCGNQMLTACQRDGRVMAVAVFGFSDLLEVRNIYGTRIYRQAMGRVVRRVRRVAGDRGLAVRTGAAQFTVLFPGMGHDRALQAIERAMGSPSRIEFDAGEHEIVLVPDLMVDTAGIDTASVQELYVEICADLATLKKNQERRHHHIQRERERHSRPMGLHAQAVRSPLGMS